MRTNDFIITCGLTFFTALAAACGGHTVVEGSGANGQGAAGPSGPGSGPGAQGPGGQGSGGQGQGGGGSIECGGFAGAQCRANEYCDYDPSTCGAADETGTCTPRPTACPDLYAPTCACDGMVYGNDCDAASAGVDINLNDGCAAPGGMFSCGAHFCFLGTDYCQVLIAEGPLPGTDTYTCKPLPSACGSNASCACLANEPCSMACQGNAASGLTVECPGGGKI